VVVQTQRYTVAEFEALIRLPEHKDRLLELIDGEIVEKMPTREHAIIVGLVVMWLNTYLWQNNLGYAAVEARHRPPDDDKNNRLPDVSYVADLSKPIERRGSAPYIPDLCIEVKSPDDTVKEMRDKAKFYLQHGARLVWLIFPEQRIVEWYAQDDEGVYGMGQELDGRDVLPGFKLLVDNIFPK
jgi:Uma2 family endonuclease